MSEFMVSIRNVRKENALIYGYDPKESNENFIFTREPIDIMNDLSKRNYNLYKIMVTRKSVIFDSIENKNEPSFLKDFFFEKAKFLLEENHREPQRFLPRHNVTLEAEIVQLNIIGRYRHTIPSLCSLIKIIDISLQEKIDFLIKYY